MLVKHVVVQEGVHNLLLVEVVTLGDQQQGLEVGYARIHDCEDEDELPDELFVHLLHAGVCEWGP